MSPTVAIILAVLLAIIAFKILKGMIKTVLLMVLVAVIYMMLTGQRVDVSKLSPFLAKPTQEQQQERTSFW